MKYFVTNNLIFSDKKNILNYNIFKNTEYNLKSHDNVFIKNKEIIKELKKSLNEQKIEFWGLIEKNILQSIKEKIDLKKYKKEKINTDNELEFQEKTSYLLVLKEIVKQLSNNKAQFNDLVHQIELYIKSNTETENHVFIEKESKLLNIHKNISALEDLKNNEYKQIEKIFIIKTTQINKEISKVKKLNIKDSSIAVKMNNWVSKKRLIDTEINLIKQNIKILKLKEKSNEKCFSKLSIFLVIITLGLILWTDIFNCSKNIVKKDKQINKLESQKIELDIKIEKLKAKLDHDKIALNQKTIEALEYKKNQLEKDKDSEISKLKKVESDILKNKEDFSILEAEINELKNNSLAGIHEEVLKVKEQLKNDIKTINDIVEQLNSQKIKLKGDFVLEI